ncbi:hypothetical protein [Halocatena pleomorpha]|uniref:Uncharacterized protein n=1 Tax=Halocatena pleomorpha TaxID=1785090 RepID=A0A3P3R849_9EURY|nr:hypothetical protein [Halocatena pleomorpha]RRJ28713.1 hypothetical protein EIK79_15020 [Halocatena pleomorpha]
MSVSPIDAQPDPRTIAADLRQRLIDEGWPEENITTQITIWGTGNCLVRVWHSVDNEEDAPPEKIEYVQYPDGKIQRKHLELDTLEMWDVIDERTIE